MVLAMLGTEKKHIEACYQKIVSNIKVAHSFSAGTFVKKGDELRLLLTDYDDEKNEKVSGSLAAYEKLNEYINDTDLSGEYILKLKRKFELERIKFFDKRKGKPIENKLLPSSSLTQHLHTLVIRTDEITRFVECLQVTSPEEKPLLPKEKNTLLILIGALCKHYGIDPSGRGVTPSVVKMTELIGAPLGDDAVRNVLHQVDPAIEKRSK